MDLEVDYSCKSLSKPFSISSGENSAKKFDQLQERRLNALRKETLDGRYEKQLTARKMDGKVDEIMEF